MSLLNNTAIATGIHAIFRVTSRCAFVGREHLPAKGQPYILAIAHLSHYDPVVVGALLRRKLDFMARAEFYETPIARWCVEHAGCVRIDRYGQALPGVREALRRLEKRRPIALFPEGEIMSGDDSVLNGGPVKGGAGLLARRSGVPIVPCVVLGSEQFRRVMPWLPLRTGRLWIGLGEPIRVAGDARPGRASRAASSAELAQAMRRVYRQMQERFDIPGEVKP
ncbi:lysophospholipid acyltransferase family protein [Algisphaera agarilytica]|uniref:1-acyl-sn-glycerol-3-phosphate acyltransferase n=1 Tax=Algisphaera agarilytica TaxID=1385975 RepID=A0A7X0H3W5_9BACT|nr:lysophospholipid acyltransferase family protein [Algisphaera agarilytica]MBB6428817.1 1-acyl-sn-glycerol-3-phosphate acyltransferase [Algisphaera agarilytica]